MIVNDKGKEYICTSCSKIISSSHIAWLFPGLVLRFHLHCAKDFSAGLYSNVRKFKVLDLERF